MFEVTLSKLQPTQAAYSKCDDNDQHGLIYMLGALLDGPTLRWQPNQMIRISFQRKTATAQLIPVCIFVENKIYV